MNNLTRLFFCLVAAALLHGCASGPRAERYNLATPGTYLQEMRYTGSYGNGRSEVPGVVARRDWNGMEVTGFRTGGVTLLVMPTGNFIGQLGPDDKLAVSWEPPLVWEFPLEVGKSWVKKYTMKMHAQNQSIPFETRQSVEAYEEVTVPAGKFMTFRVRSIDTLGNDNVQWYAPDLGMFVKSSLRRTESSANGPGTRESEIKQISR